MRIYAFILVVLSVLGCSDSGSSIPASTGGQFSLSVSPQTLPANGNAQATVTVDTPPNTSIEDLALTATAGTLGSAQAVSGQRYTVLYTAGNNSGSVTIRLLHRGEEVAVIQLVLTDDVSTTPPLGPSPTPGAPDANNSQLSLSGATAFTNGGGNVSATVTLVDSEGTPIVTGGANVVIQSTLGVVQAVRDLGTGSYVAVIDAPASPGTSQVTASVNGLMLAQTQEVNYVVEGGALVGLSVADATITEQNSTATVNVQVSLGQAPIEDVSFTVSAIAGTAQESRDFSAFSQVVSILAGSQSAQLAITILGDMVFEGEEFFFVRITDASANVLVTDGEARITIQNDDVRALNDTGIVQCRSQTTAEGVCNDAGNGTAQFPGQDGEIGRDISVASATDGLHGFSFSKLDASGNALPDQTVDFSVTPWSCVQDTVTGLYWEVKTSVAGLHNAGDLFTWFDSSAEVNGGGSGDTGAFNVCFGFSDGVIATNCNTQQFIERVNAAQLCGFNDWRLPDITELRSLLLYASSAGPQIDTQYFPNAQELEYWSRTPQAGSTLRANALNFSNAQDAVTLKNQPRAVRLVRDGS